MTASLPFLLAARGLSAAPLAVTISSGNLYEVDLRTGNYWLAAPLDPPVSCRPLTSAGGALFCTVGTEGEGTWVRRLERSSATVTWQVVFPDLDFPDGIAYSDSLLYVVARKEQPLGFYLLTLDPATGEELARIELPDLGHIDGEPQVPYALAPRGTELWLLRTEIGIGLGARRIDPSTGTTLEAFVVPGLQVAIDADFGSDGSLWISDWYPDAINFGWTTDYWKVPSLGAPAELQFSHVWHPPDPPPPTLAHFTLVESEEVTPAVEIPTLGALSAGVLAVLLSLAGVLVLRGR